MVRAILDGRKTMTRRIVHKDLVRDVIGDGENILHRCHHGKPGDRLWVRETFSIDALGGVMQNGTGEWEYEIKYRAGGSKKIKYTGPSLDDPYIKYYDNQRGDWRPSIFMPRWASRILLEVTAVRVERVQDISDTDAEREGCDGGDMKPGYSRNQFRDLWDSINAKRGAGWGANPWVWVIEFKRIAPTGPA
jgi:hypothetical protein